MRHYGMDWLRIGAFALLIFYHIGMYFSPWDWHINTPEPVRWLTVPMLASNAWRLSLLFVVSGFASAALWRARPGVGRFVSSRTLRLLLPTIFAIIVTLPIQPWIELTVDHGYRHGYGYFWLHDYFRWGRYEGVPLPSWQHLWFVVYLWVYTMVLAVGLMLPQPWRQHIRSITESALAGVRLIWVPMVVSCLWLLAYGATQATHNLIDDLPIHLFYLPQFLFGVVLFGSDTIWAAVRRHWQLAGMLAIAAFGVIAFSEVIHRMGYRGSEPLRLAYEPLRMLQCWGAIIGLIGLADRYWNHDHRWRATLTEAMFPFYVIHQTIIILVAGTLRPLELPLLAQFAIILVATVAGSWAYYLIGRRIPVLRVLIGLRGIWPPKPRSPA